MMSVHSIEALVASIPLSLGAYAPVLEEIETALQSNQCSLSSLGETIEKDPDLTARLLRLANSAFYGFANRVSTVAEAVSLIGIQQVQELIDASNVLDRFTAAPENIVNKDSFWRHSIAVGIGARQIALERHLPLADKLFVAGLLHDIGRLVLLQHAPKAAGQIFEVYRSGEMLLTSAEHQVLGFDHQDIGEGLLRYWGYPAHLVSAVAAHHRPWHSEAGRIEAAAVHVADHLAQAMELGCSGERQVPPLDVRAWELLGLDADALRRIVADMDSQIEVVESVFLKPPDRRKSA